jgi:hypothetical protein
MARTRTVKVAVLAFRPGASDFSRTHIAFYQIACVGLV